MNKNIKIDDFLKNKLNDDSIFEYQDADWNKALNLIQSNNSKKVFWTLNRKIISISAVVIALLFWIFKSELSSEPKGKQLAVSNGANEIVYQNQNSRNSQEISPSSKVEKVLSNSENGSIEKSKSTVKSNEQISFNSQRNLLNSNNSKKVNNIGATPNYPNHDSSEPILVSNNKSNSKQSLNPESNIDLNETLDYAEGKSRKPFINISKINPFKKERINTSLNENFRNLITLKEAKLDTTAIAVDFENNTISNQDFVKKKIKPYSVQLISGIGLYKQFSGNMPHNSTPTLGYLFGVGIDFYLNKKISLGTSIIMAERRGLNSQYIYFNSSNDSVNLSLQKLYSLEVPFLITYNLSKKSSCFGGLSLASYIHNSTSIKNKKADGVVLIDGYVIFGYKYFVTKKLAIQANTIIGIRDVTSNEIYKSKSREDNVGFRLSASYNIFSKE